MLPRAPSFAEGAAAATPPVKAAVPTQMKQYLLRYKILSHSGAACAGKRARTSADSIRLLTGRVLKLQSEYAVEYYKQWWDRAKSGGYV